MTPFHLPSDAPLRFVVVTVAWYNAWKAAELGSKAFFLLWDAWPSSFKNALALCGCHGCMAHLVAGCGLASKAAVMFFCSMRGPVCALTLCGCHGGKAQLAGILRDCTASAAHVDFVFWWP